MSVFPALKNETQAASAKRVEVEDVMANEARHTHRETPHTLSVMGKLAKVIDPIMDPGFAQCPLCVHREIRCTLLIWTMNRR